MANSVIGALRVVLGLDSAQFTSGAASAEKRAEQLGFRIGRAMRGAVDSTKQFTETFANVSFTVGAAAFGALAARALEYASALGETAQQLGVTTRDLQEYRYAATQVGISQEEMDKGLAKLTVSMGQAREGIEKPKAAFKELSDLLGKDVLENAATAGDAIPLIADALAKVPDPAKRAAIEVALFGRTGQKLDTLLAGGSAGVSELTQAAQNLGIVLSDEQIQQADATADKISELKTVLEASIAKGVADNAQSIYDFVTAIEKLIGKVPAAINELGKLRAYLNIAEATLNGDGGALGAAQRDLQQRQNFGKPFFGTAARNSAAAYARKVMGGKGAGAGTSDGEAKAAARSAAAEAKREARERKRAADKAARDEERYQADLGRSRDEALRAQLDVTVELIDRAQIQRELLASEDAEASARIRADRELTAAQKQTLLTLNGIITARKGELLEREAAEVLARDEVERAQAKLDNDQDILAAQANLARTSKERGRIELMILDKQFEALRLAQQAIIDRRSATTAEKDAARDRLGVLGQLQTLGRARIQRENAGPLGQLFDSLPQTAEEANEAMQRVAADGIGEVVDGLAEAAAGARTLGEVFDDVADGIVKQLIRIGLQRGVAALFNSLLGGRGQLTGSSLLDSGTGSIDVAGLGGINLPDLAGARAGGGPVVGGRNYLVGERGIEVFRAPMSGQIVANDDIGTSVEGITLNQSLTFSGAVDLATRTEVYRVADAARRAAISGVQEQQRRRA